MNFLIFFIHNYTPSREKEKEISLPVKAIEVYKSASEIASKISSF